MSEPFTPIANLLAAVAATPSAAGGMRMINERAAEFPNRLAAQLTGIALDPAGRELAERFLDDYWSDGDRQQNLLDAAGEDREVIIGSGYHAAVYAATRVLAGHPRPLVLERDQRVGGTFAMTAQPVFTLNSRNRPGGPGPAGDLGASLNFLPGAPIQAASVSAAEYQTNSDMAFVIRLTLAQAADVVPAATVTAVDVNGEGLELDLDGRYSVPARRVIDARGLGDPEDQHLANGTTILTFPQFMHRMAGTWPLRGLRRVAVLGGGDAGKCAVESLLGIAPQPAMTAAALDRVDRVDWYADRLPISCEQWREDTRGRYLAIGAHLRPDRSGSRRLIVLPRRATVADLPGLALIEGRGYDLAVLCTGSKETLIPGLGGVADCGTYTVAGAGPVAQKYVDRPAFRIGPHAQLPFSEQEFIDGIAEQPGNAAAMFRLSGKTAALAATLPPTRS
ncbi:hypothetical protein OWR29_26275 [Actinoplanes sp. Pm04-4]|uniref:Uncharacterized protein n=1 Tax=Paractinoplanes pyxinae TaxID=2997416 RepID=A0ABT4B4T2_9ACTN|nr:hypothetical protein [Actinoplanes pyxinae]MCY1141519.1 hypothetical protein [Actinoplanes pyxinae]